MEAEVSKRFECPVCLALPQKEIFQCSNGHTICHVCVEQLSNCPQCRVGYDNPKRRCRALEEVLDLTKHECTNKRLGCTAKISRDQIASHSDVCPYGGDKINLCLMLDQNFDRLKKCEYTVSSRRLQEAVEHFQNHHGFGICGSKNVNLYLENFQSSALKEDVVWTPTIVNMTDVGNKFFLLLCKYHNVDSTLSFSCLEILHHCEPNDISNISNISRCVISFPEVSKERSITLGTYCTQKSGFLKTIKDPLCRILARNALEMRNREKQLLVNFSIQGSLAPVSSPNTSVTTVHAPMSTKISINDPEKVPQVLVPRARDPDLIFQGKHCAICTQEIKCLLICCASCSKQLCLECWKTSNHFHHLSFLTQSLVAVNKLSFFNDRKISKAEIRVLRERRHHLALTRIEFRQNYRCCSSRIVLICLECRSLKGYCNRCFEALPRTNSCADHMFAVVGSRKQELDVIAVVKYLPHPYEPCKFLKWHANYSD